MDQYSDPNEILPIVDESDEPIGAAARHEIHQKGLLHRAAHVLVFDPKGRIYLQKRSAAKDTHPLKWTCSASGHVDPGETYLEAAGRELMEELGLETELTPVGKLSPTPELENEFTFVYCAISSETPRPNPAEIVEGRFFTWSQAVALAMDLESSAPCLQVVLRFAEKLRPVK